MSRGLVYVWKPDPIRELGGTVTKELVELGLLETGLGGGPLLKNRFVEVRNGGRRYLHNTTTNGYEDIAIGNVIPDSNGDFCFEAGKGGGRLDKYPHAPEDFQQRYVQAAHFGEVNTFYHINKMAAYIDGLLRALGEKSLPRVIAVVNAHHAVTTHNGVKDGLCKNEHLCLAFQGGHYRLPAKRNTVVEHHPVSADGEIHFGPGRTLVNAGALVELAGSAYRANASHNAGIIYHEYGHHITRHTADFVANKLRESHRQDNRKAAIDEGTCDYWTAAMLETPHIWAFHKRHDLTYRHPRSLASLKTMNDFDPSKDADPHVNGTIWGAALWDLRCAMRDEGDARNADLLVLKALILIGREFAPGNDLKLTRKTRAKYSQGLTKLLEADSTLFKGQFRPLILEIFAQRSIFPEGGSPPNRANHIGLPVSLKRLPSDQIPETEDIMSGACLEQILADRGTPEYSFIGVGDIMLGDRTLGPIAQFGEAYPFGGVLPLLKRGAIVCGNLEGPFAHESDRQDRTFSYRVEPKLAHALKSANVNVVTLANNHLTDCGRQGVLETFEALNAAGVHKIGAGKSEISAHAPLIMDAGSLRVGILGYYWNKRCAATIDQPGSAMDTEAWLKADIEALRSRVDRVVTVFHWGVPYERLPRPDDQAKARLAIDLGSDLVIGHHPHVIQPLEVYKGCPIFYSVGNFTFGSGNSKAEGLMVAARFEAKETIVDLYPIYVKNRDPRVNYQPKVLTGQAGSKSLEMLNNMSDLNHDQLRMDGSFGQLRLPRSVFVETTR